MECPNCKVLLYRQGKRNGVRCAMCLDELCWLTKKLRRGKKVNPRICFLNHIMFIVCLSGPQVNWNGKYQFGSGGEQGCHRWIWEVVLSVFYFFSTRVNC